jgi:hypothetical protein
MKTSGRLSLDRSSMAERFSAAMRGSVDSMDDLSLPAGRGNLKTFAVEVNGADDPETALAALADIATERGLVSSSTEDEAIMAVWDSTGSFFVDVLTPRYWLFHTTSSAAWAGKFMRDAIGNSTDLDRCWFPWELLKQVMKTGGRPKWFKSDFLGNDLLPADNVAARRMRMQFEGDDASDVLDILVGTDRLKPATALSQVATEVSGAGLGTNDELVTNAGRFVARGQSFELHVGFVGQAITTYAGLVSRTEDRYGFRWHAEEGVGLRFDGEPVLVELGREIKDMDRFVTGLFAAREPFRLWAVPNFVSDSYVEAEVVDLHVGQHFRMDISPNFLRLFLPASACGNTVLRLVTNLQHRFNATIETEELATTAP